MRLLDEIVQGSIVCAEHVHRWLNNDQAAADSANFMRHVKFEGIDEDLTAPYTPWIYYGVCIQVVSYL